jgi:hypothetical protein
MASSTILPGAVGGPVEESEGVEIRLWLDFLANRGQESAGGEHAWANVKVC